MLKLNFLLVIRQVKNDMKSFMINIIGGAIGLTAIILMALYINYEGNYDTFNENNSRLFRIERTVVDNVQNQIFDSNPYELAGELSNNFPEVINAANARSAFNFLSVGDEMFPQEQGIIADESFLEMFSFEFVAGNNDNVLSEPMNIAISESLAKKLFSDKEAMGNTVRLNKKHDFKVSGIFKDYPKNSHLAMDYMLPFEAYGRLYGVKKEKGWNENFTSTYVLLADAVNTDALNGKIRNYLIQHVDFEEGKSQGLSLRSVTDIYMNTSDVRNDSMAGARNNIVVIFLFLLVAFFTAFVTTVNYVNLTTTQLTNRELEIGMKKVMGITKTQLRYQFIIESFLMVFGALLGAAILIMLILPLFSSVVDRDLSLTFSGSGMFYLKILLVSVVVGILGGLYPVFYLASLKVSSFLQGNTSLKRRRFLRKGLVFFQLFMTIPLIFLSYNTAQQIKFLNEKDLGFKKENVLISWVHGDQEQLEQFKVIKNKLVQDPNVLEYSIAECAPFFGFGTEKEYTWEDGGSETAKFSTYGVDEDFIKVFKMNLVDGRWFSKEYPSDQVRSCVINETTVSLLGWTNPIGKTFDNGRLKVVGVVKDFDQVSLMMEIPPMVLTMNSDDVTSKIIAIKISENNQKETKKAVNEVFNAHFPEIPLELKFMEDGLDQGYFTVLENVKNIFILFSIISVALVTIGLYSLISFSLQKQQKMIAVRKILGASTNGLFQLLLKEYMVLYVLAAALSMTLTYLLILQLSKVSANNVGVGVLDFLTVIAITLFVVLASVSGKIWAASRESPIKALVAD